jgi:hypothetical protein
MFGLPHLAEIISHIRRLVTMRRCLHILAILVIVAFIGQFLAITDVALMLGIDWGLALEVSGALMILAARVQVISTARLLHHKLSAAQSRLGAYVRRGRSRVTRGSPPARLTPPPVSSDDDGGWDEDCFPVAA